MNELKEPFYKRIGHFVIDHSTALAVVILLIVVLLASLSKASAADYTPSVTFQVSQTEIIDNYTAFCTSSNHSGLVSLCYSLLNDYDYVAVSYGPAYSSNYAAYLLTFYNDDYLGVGSSDTTFFTSNQVFNYAVVCFNKSSYAAISCSNSGSLVGSLYRHNTFDSSYIYLHDAWLGGSEYNIIRQRAVNYKFNGWVSSSYYQYPFSSMNTGIDGYGSFLTINHYDNYSTAILDTYLPIFSNIKYVSDDRLKLWTINNDSGSQELVIDFTDFGTDTSNSSVSYSSLSLDIDVDGVASKIDYLDNYIEKVGNPLYSSQDILAYIPYSIFDIDSALFAKVTGVSFIKQLSTQSGEPSYETFNIAVDYYLKQEASLVSPDPIVKDPDTVSSKLTVSEITSVRNLNNYGSLQFHDFDADDIIFPENFDILFVSLSSQSSAQIVLDTVLDILAGLIYDPDGSTLLDALQRAALLNFNGITSESAAHNKIMDILGDQFYSTVFDIIYFTYDPGDGSAFTYWYYFTEAGRLRVANSYLADIYVDVNQSAYTLGSIYDYLYERLNDFEEKSLIAITGSNTLLAKSNEWLQSILNAVNNIRIPDYSGYLSSIVTGINELNSKSFFDPRNYNVLSAILTKLDNWPSSGGGSGSVNINNETYERFTAWLDGINDLDGIMTPEELANDQFGLIGDIYSYFAEGLYAKIDEFDIGLVSYARDLFDNMKSGSDHAYYNFHRQSIDLTCFR